MSFLTGFLIVLFIINCILLVVIIVPQNDSGSAGIFGPSSTQFGSRSGNVLTRTTTILGISFFAFSLILAYINKSNKFDDQDIIKASRELNGKETYKWWEVDTNKNNSKSEKSKTIPNIKTEVQTSSPKS